MMGTIQDTVTHAYIVTYMRTYIHRYVDEMIEQYDADRDGKVTFSDFRSYCHRRESDMEKAFR